MNRGRQSAARGSVTVLHAGMGRRRARRGDPQVRKPGPGPSFIDLPAAQIPARAHAGRSPMQPVHVACLLPPIARSVFSRPLASCSPARAAVLAAGRPDRRRRRACAGSSPIPGRPVGSVRVAVSDRSAPARVHGRRRRFSVRTFRRDLSLARRAPRPARRNEPTAIAADEVRTSTSARRSPRRGVGRRVRRAGRDAARGRQSASVTVITAAELRERQVESFGEPCAPCPA